MKKKNVLLCVALRKSQENAICGTFSWAFSREREKERNLLHLREKERRKMKRIKNIRKLRIQMTKHLQTFDTKRIFVFDLCFFVFKWNENELFPQSFRFDDAHTAKLLLFSTLSLRKIAHFFSIHSVVARRKTNAHFLLRNCVFSARKTAA